jgi:hypothetical protein
MITTRKAGRAMRAAMPVWLVGVFAVCLVIPGPFDELAVIVAAVVLCAVQPVRARRAASAYRGGKSHRSADLF